MTYGIKNTLLKTINRRLKLKLICVSALIAIIVEIFLCVTVFFSAKKIAIDNLIAQTEKTMAQSCVHLDEKLLVTLEQFNSIEIHKTFQEFRKSYNNNNYVDYLLQFSALFKEIRLSNNKIIDSIVFLDNNGRIFYETDLNTLSGTEFRNNDWYLECTQNDGYIYWSKPYKTTYFRRNNKEVLGVMKTLTDIESNNIGTLIFNLKKEYFENELYNIGIDNDHYIYITNNNNDFLTTVDNQEFLISINKDFPADVSSARINTPKPYYIFKEKIPTNDWCINFVIPEQGFFNQSAIIIISLLSIMLTGIILMVCFTLYTTRNLTAPLNHIQEVMSSVEDNNMNSRIKEKLLLREDEIGILSRKCNSMLDSIQELIQKTKNETELRLRAELSALQQQINSHFLYNTLESISLKIMSGDKENSFDMTRRLAQYFRLALNQGNDITTVRNEIKHIENYIAIEQYRCKNNISCIIDIDPLLLDVKMPKLLLQPLVENSIVHGLFDTDKPWEIIVSGKIIGNDMIFTVRDNGKGFENTNIEDQIKASASDKKKNFALRNIYVRIKMFYKNKSDIYLYNTSDGACVELILSLEGDFSENENDYC